MKNITLILLILQISYLTEVSSQPCLPDGITFTSQAEIDNFQINYPYCTEIEGGVYIGTYSGSNITNLNGLTVLTAIGGTLGISGNPVLTSLQGLNNLTSVGISLSIGGNNSLTSLTGLNNLTSIGGSLWVTNNPALITLEGLGNLANIGVSLEIYGNDALTSLTGLENITSIDGDIILYDDDWGAGNSSLVNFTGLNNLTSIGGDFLIVWNSGLINFTGLENLVYIGGYLNIGVNNSLTSLTGLGSLDFIGALSIYANDALIDLTGLNLNSIGSLRIINNDSMTSLSGLENLTIIDGNLEIGGNDALVSLAGLNNLTSISGNLTIGEDYMQGNPSLLSLTGLVNVSTIGGNISITDNDALASLNGLENIDAGSVESLYISGNLSLSECDVQCICDYLANPNGIVEIFENAIGCNNPTEIADVCGIILDCLPYGNYFFLTQDDIDNFTTNYPGCSDLEGNVKINGFDITNLNGLNVLNSTTGHVIIHGNGSLSNLSGLDGLSTINGLGIYWNPILTSLEGLENVTSIIGGLGINENDALISLAALGNVSDFSGGLRITRNDALVNLMGLENIIADSINGLFIYENSSLSTCEVQSVCDYLVAPNGEIWIDDNAPGCNSPEEVEDGCWTSVEEIGFDNKYSISPNPTKSAAVITYTLYQSSTVTLNILDLSGREMLRIVDGFQDRGEQKVMLDTKGLNSGVYFCVLKTNNEIQSLKLIKH